jgi:hypothetical protein
MDTRPATGRRRTLILLAALLCALTLSGSAGTAWARRAAGNGRGGAGGGGVVVLGREHGLTLTGPLSALWHGVRPHLSSFTASQADARAVLPKARIFLRGAACSGAHKFARVVTLTFELPKALFRGAALPVFRWAAHAWQRIRPTATVGAVNSTASVSVTRPGRYVLCLGDGWKVDSQDGYTLVVRTGLIPRTVLRRPQVVAQGDVDDPAVIAAVATAMGGTTEKAVSTLTSYDSSGSRLVRVVTLTEPLTVVRNWSGDLVGRWFDPYLGVLQTPDAARRLFALPNTNTAVNATLHGVHPGVTLIDGWCADMTWDAADYGPYATGGGYQYFGPMVSTYPPPAYDPGKIDIVSELRWEKSVSDEMQW